MLWVYIKKCSSTKFSKDSIKELYIYSAQIQRLKLESIGHIGVYGNKTATKLAVRFTVHPTKIKLQ